MKALNKLAVTSAIGACLAGISLPSQAIVQAVGEAQLIPLVVYAYDDAATQTDGDINTIIEVTVPNVLGWEAVTNTFLAPNSSPTNPTPFPGALLFPDNEALTNPSSTSAAIHWYWFDYESIHRIDRRVPVTPNDIVQINWRQAAGTSWNGTPGYMVIGTETARTGAAADFAFFTDAHLIYAGGADDATSTDVYTTTTWSVHIPVLALVDGEDGAFDAPVTNLDNVKYTGGGIPRAVSPLVSGIRSSLNDDALDDVVVFDVTLSNRQFDTLQVVWVDTNLGDIDGYSPFIPVSVYDTEENACSSVVELPYELNLVVVEGESAVDGPLDEGATEDLLAVGNSWVERPNLCIPFDVAGNQSTDQGGMVIYQMPEYLDETTLGITGPESSIYAFSIIFDRVPYSITPTSAFWPNFLNGAVALGHDRGMFDN